MILFSAKKIEAQHQKYPPHYHVKLQELNYKFSDAFI